MSNFEVLILDNDKETRNLAYTPFLQKEFPDLQESFAEVDQKLGQPKDEFLGGQQFELDLGDGYKDVAVSTIFDVESQKSTEALVIFAPFSDVKPESDGATIRQYMQSVQDGESIGFKDKQHARPHSWNQTTKSRTIHDLLAAEGHAMPVITVFSPIPLGAYDREQRKNFKNGDFLAAADVAEAAILKLQEHLHGTRSETQISGVHTNGASLGASNAVGAAIGINSDRFDLKTVTAQELILGPAGLGSLARRFTIGATVGEASSEGTSALVDSIPEPLMRRLVDAAGNEPAMFLRMAKGASKIPYLKGLTQPNRIREDLEQLTNDGVFVLSALAANSGLTKDTPRFLPLGHENFMLAKVVGVNGKKADHLINEHVTASATIALMGVSRLR